VSLNSLMSRFAFVWLGVLLAIDAALISGDILHRQGVLTDRRFSVSLERGFGEMFEYAKLTATASVLVWTAFRWHSWATGFWAVLLGYLVADNAFAVHERMGAVLARQLLLPRIGNMRPVDFGELCFLGLVGAVAAIGFAAIMRFASSRVRRLTWQLGAGLFALAVFGVGLDVVHRLVSRTSLQSTAAVVEDGGELVVTSLLLWVTWRVCGQRSLD
jgi:hypothetical protein